jgi:predicted kinase
LFAERARSGFVVDGHGDLRPEHIYFLPEPVIVDCIEFNAEFRRIEALDELSFLAIECERLGAQWIGKQLLAGELATAGGPPNPLLVDFYSSYRACVRAKVHCLRARQLSEQEAIESQECVQSYLELAARHAERLERPLLVIVYGLSGTGKSTISTALGNSLGFAVLSTDILRKQLMGSATPTERYRPESREEVYQALLAQASERLATGESLVVDGTFAQRRIRQQAIDIAHRNHAMVLFVHCECREQVALKRIARRMQDHTSPSDATTDVYLQQAASFEADQPGSAAVVTIDTERDLEVNLAQVREILFPC